MSKIAIIGGGFAGLGAAYELIKKEGHEVTIFERGNGLGGLAITVDIAGQPLEIFYHHMYPSYRDFLEIADEVGMKDKMFFCRAKTGTLYRGKLYPFDSPLDLLRFEPLTLWERLRTGFGLARLRFVRNWRRFDGVTAEEWAKKNLGEKSYAVLWEPLFSSKFGPLAGKVGMAWFWGKIYERPARFGYFRGSFKTMTEAIGNYLRDRGVRFKLGTGVDNLAKNPGGTFAITTSAGTETFDQVIVAAAPPQFLNFAADMLPPDFVAHAKNLKYMGAICAIAVLKKQFSPFYWLNVNDKDFPFVGVIEQSNFVSPETYSGLHPVYLSKYLDPGSDFYKLSDEEIWARYLPAMKRINPEFSEDWIVQKYVFRTPLAQPVITADYSRTGPAYRTPVAGLWWVSMSHVYPWDRGTDHAFHAGRELVREMLAS